MRSRLRDPENKLYTDDEYSQYLWMTRTCGVNRRTVYARKSDSPGLYFFDSCSQLWQVEVQSPTAGQDYEINEPAGIIYNPQQGETRTTLTLLAFPVDVDIAMYNALMDAATNPAKSAIYMASNGFTVDSREAPRILREQAQHILGQR